MVNNDNYATRYASLTDLELNLLFSTDQWNSPEMGPKEKLEACQELENRLAQADGTQPRRVISGDMDGNVYGSQVGSVIVLNSSVLEKGVSKADYLDEQGNHQVQSIPVAAPNWSTYEAVCHEHQHFVQIDQERSQDQAYIDSSVDYDLYRLQPDECEAFDVGISRTISAIQQVENALGREDQNKRAYLTSLQVDSYEDALARAQMHYQDMHIQQTIDTVVRDYRDCKNRSYGKPSELAIAWAIERSQSQESYLKQMPYDIASSDQQEVDSMAWEYGFPDDENTIEAPLESQDVSQELSEDYEWC